MSDAISHSEADGLRPDREHNTLLADISDLQAFVASLPDRDTRSADEILGYDDFGLPSR
ncbi:hypothetical protein [Longimicrobium sp.]|uniref:hypothetical protein n=1 Tax=Longimicrobium sp. TaxID=2029185 RepID=UPI002F95402B